MKEIILHKGQHQEAEHPEPESDHMLNIKYVNIRSKYIYLKNETGEFVSTFP